MSILTSLAVLKDKDPEYNFSLVIARMAAVVRERLQALILLFSGKMGAGWQGADA